MRRLALALALLVLALAATAANAQEGPTIRPPPGLVTQLMRDFDEGDDFAYMSRDSVRAGITVQRTDLNGDGIPEYFVTGSRTCGTNCERWIYRRLAGGGYRRMYVDWVSSIDVLPARRHGWHSISTWYHFSCCEGSSTLYEFDGTTYAWRETKWQRDRRGEHTADTTMRTLYRVSITPPGARRHLALDPMTATNGVRFEAGYDVCGRNAACGEPWLRLSSPQLPAGRVCVWMRVLSDEMHNVAEQWRDCAVSSPGPERGMRTLVLHPTRREWGLLGLGSGLEMAIPRVAGGIGDYTGWAVSAFASALSEHYHVPCPAGHSCR